MCDFFEFVVDILSFGYSPSVPSARSVISFILISGGLIYFGVSWEVALMIALVSCWPVGWVLYFLTLLMYAPFARMGKERTRRIKVKVALDMLKQDNAIASTKYNSHRP